MLEKRTWVYVGQPNDYGIAPCVCGNENTKWSEWKNHLWCDKCKIDFIPKHNGVFDGPVLSDTANILGFDFRRICIATKKLLNDEEITDK